jgi:hypothetical protein
VGTAAARLIEAVRHQNHPAFVENFVGFFVGIRENWGTLAL